MGLRDVFETAAANCAPGVAWVAVGQPFDVVQVRLQTTPSEMKSRAASQTLLDQQRHFRGAWHCLRTTVAYEGPLALWKGAVPSVVLSVPYSSVMFTTFQALKPKAVPPLGDPSGEYFRGVFLAGFACGIPLTLLQNPLDVWRTRLQTSYSARLGNSVLRSILSSANPREVLLRGSSITLARNSLGNGIYFCLYEATTRAWDRSAIGRSRVREDEGSIDAATKERKDAPAEAFDFSKSIVCGGVTGVIFNALFHPLMTVRAQMQALSPLENTGTPSQRTTLRVRDVARTLYAAAGLRGFWRGASIVL